MLALIVPKQLLLALETYLDLILELLALKQALGLLSLAFGIVTGGSLLRLCCDLNRLLNRS